MHRYIGMVALVAVTASCDKDSFVGPVDGPAATLTVYGQVTRADGAGVPSVEMAIEARSQGACTNSRMDVATATTDASGRYRATLFNWGTQYTVCVNVEATPASASGLAADSLQRSPAVMRSQDPDSIRVDVVLQPTD